MSNPWEKKIYYEDIENSRPQNINDDIIFSNLVKEISGIKGKYFLDFGCGEGWLIDNLTKKFLNNKNFTGVDVSETGVSIAKSKKIGNSEFFTYNGVSLPFNDNYFDGAFSSFVFEHLEQPENAFREISRVVKSGGKIIIACPNFGSPLFKSPCNKTPRLFKGLTGLFKEIIPSNFFKNSFFWKKVTPIDLGDDNHISDYDTVCEPSLSMFKKYLMANSDKYILERSSSFWESFDSYLLDRNNSFIKRLLIYIFAYLGKNKIFKFDSYGSFFFVVVKKI